MALPPADFRATRCFLSESLTDLASVCEKVCWSANLPFLSTLDHADLEDSKGFYHCLNVNKSSSDADVASSFHEAKTTFKAVALVHHPDKAKGNESSIQIFNNAKDLYERQKEAHKIIGKPNCYGSAYPDRVIYDRLGEKFRKQFRTAFEIQYPNKSYSVRANEIDAERKRKEIYERVSATKDKKKKENTPIMERVIHNWKKVGHQTNRCRAVVYQCIDAGYSIAEISRHIRLNVYSSDRYTWNGVCESDRRYRAIRMTIDRIWKAGIAGKLGTLRGKPSMTSTSVKPGARGRVILNPRKKVRR